MPNVDKPYIESGPPTTTPYVPPPSGSQSGRPAVSARRGTTLATPFAEAPLLDASATENRPCSIDNVREDTVPRRWMW